MKTINKIHVIACLHGNEIFGMKVLANLTELADERISVSIGNLGAVSKRVRFIESDLNRSFGVTVVPTRESRLAKRLVYDIKTINPDLVIDIHTSSVDVGRAAIVAEQSPFLSAVARSLSMSRLAIMLQDVISKSLLGQFPHKGISLEFGKHHRSDKLALETARSIVGLLGQQLGSQASKTTVETYRVTKIVAKSEIIGLPFANFEFNEALGGYPFLMGESNYSEIAGFLAARIS